MKSLGCVRRPNNAFLAPRPVENLTNARVDGITIALRTINVIVRLCHAMEIVKEAVGIVRGTEVTISLEMAEVAV